MACDAATAEMAGSSTSGAKPYAARAALIWFRAEPARLVAGAAGGTAGAVTVVCGVTASSTAGGAVGLNDHVALTRLPSASRPPLRSEISNAGPAASGRAGVKVSWVDASFHVALPETVEPVTVSVTRSALLVARRSIGRLNHIDTFAGSTSLALRPGSVFVSWALDWTMNEKLPSPPSALPSRSCDP